MRAAAAFTGRSQPRAARARWRSCCVLLHVRAYVRTYGGRYDPDFAGRLAVGLGHAGVPCGSEEVGASVGWAVRPVHDAAWTVEESRLLVSVCLLEDLFVCFCADGDPDLLNRLSRAHVVRRFDLLSSV